MGNRAEGKRTQVLIGVLAGAVLVLLIVVWLLVSRRDERNLAPLVVPAAGEGFRGSNPYAEPPGDQYERRAREQARQRLPGQ